MQFAQESIHFYPKNDIFPLNLLFLLKLGGVIYLLFIFCLFFFNILHIYIIIMVSNQAE